MGARVVQVLGSIEYEGYSELNFSIEGRRYGPCKLVASALAEHLRERGRDCKVTLLLPESLVTKLAETPEEAEALLRDREELAREAGRRLRALLGTGFEVRAIQGLGHYALGDNKTALEFENSIGNVSSYVLVEMAGSFDGDEELYFCTSTGHNAYLLAVQMALSVYTAYRAFVDRASGDDPRRFVLRTVYHPFPSKVSEVPVELEPTRHKAFFDLPEVRTQLVADRTPEAIELRRRLHRLTDEMRGELSRARLAFNAVRYNAPLVMGYLERPDGRRTLTLLMEALEVIENARSIVTEGGTIRVRRFRVDRGEVNGLVITAALSTYLSRVIESVRSTGGRLGSLLEVMKRVYSEQRLGLNEYVLEREADQVSRAARERMRPGERRLLRDVLQLGGSGNAKRNFFAHAGLLADWTYVTLTEEGELVLDYDAERIGEVRDWLRDPTPSGP